MKSDRHLLVSRRKTLVTTVSVTLGACATALLGRPIPALAQSAEVVGNAFTNSVGMEFIAISAGAFLMGSPDSDREAEADEKPAHRVTISKPFLLGKFEVTQAQWEAVMGSSPYGGARSNPYFDLPGMAKRVRQPNNPVTVSWNEAQQFLQRLNQREGHLLYRLPTEAEWEYAARAGTSTSYSFGNDRALLGRYAWHGENFATGSPHPVGSKLPNPWGLHDMHGNVWEWVQDNYGRYDAAAATDPTGPASGAGKVVRGGSWHVTAGGWRSAHRKEYPADYRGISIGFRLVRMASVEQPHETSPQPADREL